MSAFTTVTVQISKTKTKKIAGKKIGEKFNLSAAEAKVKFRKIRTAYCRYLKRLKTLPFGSGRDAVQRNFCEPKTDVFDGFEADHDVA